MNRHRFWNYGLLALVVLIATGCMLRSGTDSRTAAAPAQAHPQRAPGMYQPLAPESATIQQGIAPQTVAVTQTVKVGLLLPITGRHAELGKALQDAAAISLFDKYARLSPNQQSIRVELIPQDTGDTPRQAAAAAQAALDAGATLLIGPIFSDATEAVVPVAAARNVPVLSFSNSFARAGKGVYVFGFSPQEQTARVVRFSISSGKLRIAALIPNSPLGETVRVGMREVLKKAELTPVAEVTYTSQGVDMDKALTQLVPVEGKPNFDALLVPEGGPALDIMLRALATRGVTPANVQFLGTGIWDDPMLLHRVNLDGAWFATSPPQSTAQFLDRFQSTYHYTPPRIASLAYDAVALAVTLATSGRPYTNANLVSEAGFLGPANGIFRLRNSGQVERGLAIVRIQAGALQVISPAPETMMGQ